METHVALLAAAGLVSSIANVAVALRLRRQAQEQAPSLSCPDSGTGDDGQEATSWDLSVLVPARDEEKNLGACMVSVLAQSPPVRELTVFDDASRDGTAAVAGKICATNGRARVVSGRDVPSGWTGKCHALHQLARESRGEMLLFIDADTRLLPGAIDAAMRYVKSRRLDALSCLGRREPCTVWDGIWEPLWPSFLYLATGRLDRLGARGSRRRFASGAWMLISRAAYDRVGGYAAIKGEVIEDCAMAGRLVEHGLRFEVVHAPSLYTLRMYDSLTALFRGWAKNAYRLLTDMLGYSGLAFGAGILAVLCMSIVPLVVSLLAIWLREPVWIAVLQLPLLVAFGVWAAIRHATTTRPGLFWTLPIAGLLVVSVLVTSAVRVLLGVGVTWKERRYVQ